VQFVRTAERCDAPRYDPDPSLPRLGHDFARAPRGSAPGKIRQRRPSTRVAHSAPPNGRCPRARFRSCICGGSHGVAGTRRRKRETARAHPASAPGASRVRRAATSKAESARVSCETLAVPRRWQAPARRRGCYPLKPAPRAILPRTRDPRDRLEPAGTLYSARCRRGTSLSFRSPEDSFPESCPGPGRLPPRGRAFMCRLTTPLVIFLDHGFAEPLCREYGHESK